MTLGNAAAARVRLIVWCKACRYQVEPDPAEMAERYGAETAVFDWGDRLVFSGAGLPDAKLRLAHIGQTAERSMTRLDAGCSKNRG